MIWLNEHCLRDSRDMFVVEGNLFKKCYCLSCLRSIVDSSSESSHDIIQLYIYVVYIKKYIFVICIYIHINK